MSEGVKSGLRTQRDVAEEQFLGQNGPVSGYQRAIEQHIVGRRDVVRVVRGFKYPEHDLVGHVFHGAWLGRRRHSGLYNCGLRWRHDRIHESETHTVFLNLNENRDAKGGEMKGGSVLRVKCRLT